MDCLGNVSNNSCVMNKVGGPRFDELLTLNILTCVFGVIALVGNSWVAHLYFRFKQLRKEDCILLIVSMAISDCVLGLGCIIAGNDRIRLQFMEHPHFEKSRCIGASLVMLIGMHSSQLYACIIAVDRFLAIRSPIKYSTKDHAKFAKLANGFVLVFLVVATACMFIGVDLEEKPAVCNAGASWTYSYRVYWLVFSFTVGIMVIAVYATTMFLLNKKLNMTISTAPGNQNAQLLRQAKVTRLMSMIMLMYIILWVLPNAAYNVATVANVPGAILGRIGPYCALGSVVNACSNLFVYGLKHQEIRKFSKQAFC